MANIATPLHLNFKTWANQLRSSLITYYIPIPPDVSEWRDWANQIVNTNQITNIPIATKISYPLDKNWRDWALRFYAIIQIQKK